jgi:hypothetical protein
MNTRVAQRRSAGRTRPAPEWVAAGMVLVLYAVVSFVTLGLGPALLSVATTPVQTEAPRPSASIAAVAPSSDPIRLGVAGVLEINTRLTAAGKELKDIIARSPFRGSEAAFVLRRIKTTLLPAGDRVAVLFTDESTKEVGAQLELLYAQADTTVEQASDLALGSDREYREAAAEIVDLFRDLPTIDERLRAIVALRESPSAAPNVSPSAIAVASPSSAPVASAAPGQSASPAVSANPAELLRDPGFETGLDSWTRRATAGATLPAVGPGEPLSPAGNQSLKVDVPATLSPAMVSIGQGPIALRAGTRYLMTVAIRADSSRSAQVRLVGPAEETYGIALVEIGPTTIEASLEFLAVADQPGATLWIDLGGPNSGTVWLDDASLTPVAS